jgi:HEAT repeat protein
MLAVAIVGGQPISQDNGPGPTFDELLKRYNIQLTHPALVDALKNTDLEVRDLAANKLADDKAVETIPAIKDALASEKVPWTRMNIAFALAQMGESIGFDTLEDNCKNKGTTGAIRTRSAEYLLRFNRDSTTCLSGVLDVVKGGSNGDRMAAAELLPRYHNLSKEESETVFTGLVEALHAPDPSVRMAAGQALADLGDKRGIAELGRAVGVEQEQAPKKRQKRECCGSTELPTIVARRSWSEISGGKLGTLIQQTKNSLNFASTCLKVVDTRRAFSLAGLEVALSGRFWVTPEGANLDSIDQKPHSGMANLPSAQRATSRIMLCFCDYRAVFSANLEAMAHTRRSSEASGWSDVRLSLHDKARHSIEGR